MHDSTPRHDSLTPDIKPADTALRPAFQVVLIVAAVIVFAFIICGLARPEAWQRFFSGILFFDEEHYLNIAKHGYEQGPKAFHPLYSWLVAGFAAIVGQFVEMPLWLAGRILSFGLFLGSLVLMLHVLRHVVNERSAVLGTVLFGINPFTIFHTLSYTESLYSLLGLGLIAAILWMLREPSGWALLVNFVIAFAMAWCRPSYFIFIAVIAGFAGLYFLQVLLLQQIWPQQTVSFKEGAPPNERRRFMLSLAVAVLAIAAGTAGFFAYLDYATGSPWSTLEAQKNFDRSFGFYWQLFFAPSTLNGSDNILVWELHAFYLPMLLALAFLFYSKWRESLSSKGFYVFWYATFFTGAHIAANVFTHPKFYSLGRHVLAQPYFFIALAFAFDALADRRWLRYLIWFYLCASFAYLCNYWDRFSIGMWIG